MPDEEYFDAKKQTEINSMLGEPFSQKDFNTNATELSCVEDIEEDIEEILPEPIPKLDSLAFYGIAGEFALEATKESEADPAAVLIQCLAYFAISAGRNRFYRLGFANHHPRLFAVLVGNSSKSRKGTSWEPVKALFLKMKELGANVSEWKPGPFSSGEGIIQTVRDPSEELNDKNNEPKDAGVIDKRLLVFTSEFAAGLRVMRREGNILSTVIRALFDGDDIAPITKSNLIKSTAPHIGIIGHITKQELTRELDHVEIFNGFGNRFLWPFVRRPKLVPFPKAIEEQRFNELAKKFKATLDFAQQPGELVLSDGVKAIWSRIYTELQTEVSGLAGVLINRSEAHVIRLALIYALLDQSSLIDMPHIKAALTLWNFCMESIFYIFGSEVDEITARIILALKSRPYSQTEISKLFSGHVSSSKLKQKLSDLEVIGKIARLSIKTPGRRTKTVWKSTERKYENYAN